MTITYNSLQGTPGLLAEKETRYLLGFAQGFSDKEVARDCGVSHNTVAGARKRIFYKLNARRMTDAVGKAFSMGLIRQLLVLLVLVSGLQDSDFIRTRTPRPTQPTSPARYWRDAASC